MRKKQFLFQMQRVLTPMCSGVGSSVYLPFFFLHFVKGSAKKPDGLPNSLP